MYFNYEPCGSREPEDRNDKGDFLFFEWRWLWPGCRQGLKETGWNLDSEEGIRVWNSATQGTKAGRHLPPSPRYFRNQISLLESEAEGSRFACGLLQPMPAHSFRPYNLLNHSPQRWVFVSEENSGLSKQVWRELEESIISHHPLKKINTGLGLEG